MDAGAPCSSVKPMHGFFTFSEAAYCPVWNIVLKKSANTILKIENDVNIE